MQCVVVSEVVVKDMFVCITPSHSHRVTFGNIKLHLSISLPKCKAVKIFLPKRHPAKNGCSLQDTIAREQTS